ncbi:MAG: hypothetical protein ACOZF2_00675 [Thermodesulfobacteriota bacterium]
MAGEQRRGAAPPPGRTGEEGGSLRLVSQATVDGLEAGGLRGAGGSRSVPVKPF